MNGGAMIRFTLRLLPVVMLLLAGPSLAAERVALVIGNTAYHDSPLRNPINDARAMNLALTHLGFDVVLLTDGDQRAMQRAIGQFGRKLRGAKEALIYYSGHGIQAGGINYMVPIGAELESEADMPLELVSVDAVMTQLVQAGTNVNILILDACRNNPFERGMHRAVGGGGGGLAGIAAPKGTVIAYATAPGTTAADGTGDNSPYTTALLRALSKPGKKVEEVFKDTRIELAHVTENKQISWESSSLVGDFYFSAPGGAPPAHPAALHNASAPSPQAPAHSGPQHQPTKVAPEPEGPSSPAQSLAHDARGKVVFDIVNGLAQPITRLYLVPSSSENWEDSLLDAPLDAGETLEMTVDDNVSECHYDLRAVFKGRKDLEHRNVNICKLTSFVVE